MMFVYRIKLVMNNINANVRKKVYLQLKDITTRLELSLTLWLGDYRKGETLDPISNSIVKPFIADGTLS